MTDIETAMQIVLELARTVAATPEQIEACNTVEDFAVNILAEELRNFPEGE